jgi:serine/threonine-protein kinase
MNSGIELDDLKTAWGQLDQRLARIEALQVEGRRHEAGLRQRKGVSASVRALRPLLFGQVLQALIGTATIVLAAMFWNTHAERLHLLLAGISLHVYGVWMLASAGHEISLLWKVRYTTPVLELQQQLATLRRWRSRNGLVFAYAGCFIWIPAMLMLFASLGADVWAHQPAVVGWLFVSGAVCALAVNLGLRWARSPQRPKLAQHMHEHAAGVSLHRAELALGDLEAFDAEVR